MARQCWVIKDKFSGDVCFYRKKKEAIEDGRNGHRFSLFHYACESDFRRFTGLKLEPGKLVKVRFSGEILSK